MPLPVLLPLLLAAPLSTPGPAARPSPATAPPRPAEARGEEDDPLTPLPARWESLRERLHVPGLAVCVVVDGEVRLLSGFGQRDLQGDPVTADTTFYIASCTKTYVALCVASLADEGRIDLQAPVVEYLPQLELADVVLNETLTVEDLLCHAKGIQCYPCVLLDAYTGEITEERYFRHLREFRPAGHTDYSNVHFTLLGRVVEAVTGRPWRDELARRLFEPMGFTKTTGYADRMYAWDDVAFPMQWNGERYELDPVRKTDRTMHAAGGLGTSARDAGRYLRTLTGGGELEGREIVSLDALLDMLTLHSEAQRRQSDRIHMEGFGHGWMLGTWMEKPCAMHGGGYTGAAALLSFLPEHGVGVAALANTDLTGHALCDLVVEDVYAALFDQELLSPEDGVARALARHEERRLAAAASLAEGENPTRVAGGLSAPADLYAGVYENELWGTVTVTLAEGELSLRIGDLGCRMTGTGQDAFQLHGGVDERGRFELEAGRPVAVVIELAEGDRPVRFARRR